jgi:hypothetical protein
MRRPGTLTSPQFWAEDSIVFYHDQLILGWFHALLTPHAGYMCSMARLIALVSSGLPAALVPVAFNSAALALACLSCTFLFLPWYRHLIESQALRAVLCVLFAAGFVVDEMVGNVTNVQWYLALPGILLLARSPQDDETCGIPKLLGFAAGAFIIGLSSPVLIILLPICAGMLARRGLRRCVMIPCGLLLALSIQTVVMLSSPGIGGIWPIERTVLGDITVCILYRSVLPALAGQGRSQFLANNFLDASVVVFLIVAVLWTVWFWRAEKAHRLRLTITLYLAIASVAIAIVVRGKPAGFASLSGVKIWGAERFFYLASCVFGYLAARWLSRIAPNRGGAAILFSILFMGGVVADFRVPRLFDYWSQDAPAVDTWRRGMHGGRAEGIELPVNPPGWKLRLPGNVPANAGFEGANLSPWGAFGSATAGLSSALSYEGKQALELANAGGVFQDIVGLREGALYRISARVRSACGSPSFGSIWLHDTFGGNAVTDGPRQVSCDRWDEFAADFRAGSRGMLRIHLVGVTERGRLFWDDVRMVQRQ